MSETGDKAHTAKGDKETREERLARQLRENLRRRKAQSRAIQAGSGVAGAKGD
ncbi:hypothetical protein [Croceicoccus naphthovorans]|uniref:hypothetical protein n=1 Tax=Croceicoccus naphthovorans TaxID=1348774 RepID=UPI000AB06632|nr:hypothetical protein [Croceicoccus naphthovorans]MBB3989551.1 hypothetical protein [Croceicoccus naphthovorans]